MSEPIKVGGDIEAYCTTCRTMKWHVIVAVVDGKPAKVECAGCHKQHQYRAQAPGTASPKAPAKPRARAAAAEPVATTPSLSETQLEEKLRAGEASARAYAPRDRYAEGELVRHPTFGVGVVVALPTAQKMEVQFRSGRKLLVHERTGEAPASTMPARPVPREEAPMGYTPDAPPRRS